MFLTLIIGLIICDMAIIYLDACGYCFGRSNKMLIFFSHAGLGDFLMFIFSTGLIIESHHMNFLFQTILFIIVAFISFMNFIVKFTKFLKDRNPRIRPRI